MTRIAIFGGTGYAGTHLASEAVGRGIDVISYSRTAPDGASRVAGVEYRTGSVDDPGARAAAIADADVVVVTIPPGAGLGAGYREVALALAAEAAESGVRVGFVGGAGSSFVSEGGPRLVDTPEFHPDWKPEALVLADTLDALRETPDEVDWFVVSPAALFGSYGPQEARGTYRTGGDVLVTDADGGSAISGADYARAFVDEIESAAHRRQRFTVGW
ncbi:NAD(P)-dependent oxidoreductase [Agromyces larvae]|uniref:NAD(P)H-binding protein n=1 Tax=Agromyces larvae TaxID=2929802 RepID=A0ABY4BUM0_9MICO|nr:NAD(P)H-binding protein [Agromyces larvae]UOE42874.1 NAD(P)H-binding protein [Agromyces larvae]